MVSVGTEARALRNAVLFSLEGRDRRSAVVLCIESLVAGIVEAGLLLIVVDAALAVSDPESTSKISLPVAEGFAIGVPGALAVAGAFGLTSLLLHLDVARRMARLSAATLISYRSRVIRAFTDASWEQQSQAREGALQEAVSTLSGQASTLALAEATLASSALGLGALLGAAVFVDPVASASVLVVGAGLFFVLRPLASLTRRMASAFVQANSDFTEGITEWTALAMELRSFGVERSVLSRQLAGVRTTAIALQNTRFASRAGAMVFRDVAVLFVVASLAVAAVWQTTDLSSVGAVVLLIVRAILYAQQTQQGLQQIHELTPNRTELESRISELENARSDSGHRRRSTILPIVLENVSYTYPDSRPALQNISLRIDRGETVGVIGPSGGGKTSFAQVLLRLRTPTRGHVRSAGIPYEQIEADDWTRLTTLIPQEPRLFEGTIRENIAFWRTELSDDAIETAATLAQILPEISQLPAGLDTHLGPRGSGLSGGQRQRLAIARALAGNPELLVLDEPTSALDPRSEQAVHAALESIKGRLTIVIIAHRHSTLKFCDRIIGIAEGSVVSEGSLSDVVRDLDHFGEVDLDA